MDELRLGKFTQKLNLSVVIVPPLCSRNTWFDLFEHLEGLVRSLPQEYTPLLRWFCNFK